MLQAESTVTAMAFTPNGAMIATAESRGQVRLWDMNNATELYKWEYFSENPRSLAISPNGDALALGCFDGTLLLLDLDSGKEVYRAKAHEGLITSLDFDTSGRRIVTAGVDMNAVVWDLSKWM